MTVRAWEHLDTRFVGTTAQFAVFGEANGWPEISVVSRATEAERAKWRRDNGRWFVLPVAHFAADHHAQVDNDGDAVRAEVDSSDGYVAIYRNPKSTTPECLAMLDPEMADRLGRQLMRVAMVVRALRRQNGAGGE